MQRLRPPAATAPEQALDWIVRYPRTSAFRLPVDIFDRVTEFESVAPVLPTRDVPAALARYERLGFDVSVYDGGDFYGYASRGGVSLHLSRVENVDPKTTLVSVYVYVSDADALHTEWSSSGVEGRFHRPTDTDYGLREGAYVDPDGNLLRYGSPLP